MKLSIVDFMFRSIRDADASVTCAATCLSRHRHFRDVRQPRGLALKDAKITSAQVVPAGQFSAPGGPQAAGARNPYKTLPEFCRVAATLTPSSDSDIKVEVWLPAANWNGKFQAVGNGGWAGVISYSAMADAIRAGYATASTDTGHTTPGGAFALRSSRKADRFRLAL